MPRPPKHLVVCVAELRAYSHDNTYHGMVGTTVVVMVRLLQMATLESCRLKWPVDRRLMSMSLMQLGDTCCIGLQVALRRCANKRWCTARS